MTSTATIPPSVSLGRMLHPRFTVTGAPGAQQLVPANLRAAVLTKEPAGQAFVTGVASLLRGFATEGTPSTLASLELPTTDQGWRDALIDASIEDTTKRAGRPLLPAEAADVTRQAEAIALEAEGVTSKSGDVVLAPHVVQSLLTTFATGTASPAAANAARVFTHELEHTISPDPTLASVTNLRWLEEGGSELLAHTRLATSLRELGLPAMKPTGIAYSDSVLAVAHLASLTTPGSSMRELLQGRALTDVPAELATRIAARHQLGAAERTLLTQQFDAFDGSKASAEVIAAFVAERAAVARGAAAVTPS
ncbi:MAG: hypothetical protein JWM90_910 [Thermoleophilia bacterium]|nr:hypothetical protein [Thermoleophilia bacterium]